MTSARVPAGTSDGGRFAPTVRSESDLRLTADPVPAFPAPTDITAENRHQRAEEYAARLHAIATHPGADRHTRRMAALTALDKVADARGRFLSLPPDDGEAQSHVADALLDDAKVDAALARVGVLDEDQTHTFADRLAGALYDIEVADRDDRLAAAAIAEAPARGCDENGWPVGLPTRPPREEGTTPPDLPSGPRPDAAEPRF
jgi:hypothetical protein